MIVSVRATAVQRSLHQTQNQRQPLPKNTHHSTHTHTKSARFLGAAPFGAVTAALLAYFTLMLRRDAAAKGLKNPLGSYGDVFFGGSGGKAAPAA